MTYLKAVNKISAATEAIHELHEQTVYKPRIEHGTPSIRNNNNCLPYELLLQNAMSLN